MSLPATGVIISEAPPLQVESPFAGLDDIPIPNFVSSPHDAGMEGLDSACEPSGSLAMSAADISGWSGDCTCIHFTTLHDPQLYFVQLRKLLTLSSLLIFRYCVWKRINAEQSSFIPKGFWLLRFPQEGF